MTRKINFFAILFFCAMMSLPFAAFANNGAVAAALDDSDDYVIIDGERNILARLEFEPDQTRLTAASADALAKIAPLFADGVTRRYEIHGHFCAGVEGSRSIAMSRTETIVQHFIAQGVSEGDILSLVNASTARRLTAGCAHDRRVDVMSVDRRRVHKSEAAEIAAAVAVADSANVANELITDEDPIAIAEPTPVINDMDDIMTRGRETFAEPEPTPATPVTSPAPALPADAQNRQTVAVYMAGEEPQGVRGVHNILGGELARVISESERYLAVDRTDYILELLEVEHEYQRSGMVDDDQIKDLGRQLGVQFMCISNITPIGNRRAYYLDVRLVDVETAEIIRSVTANSNLRDANEKMRIAREIALELIETDRTLAERARRKKMFRYIAIGLDILGAGAIAYGIIENNNVASNVDDGTYTAADRAVTRRNVGYIVGGALIASGVTIHIMF